MAKNKTKNKTHPDTKKCARCSKEFKYRGNKKYCSATCRTTAWSERVGYAPRSGYFNARAKHFKLNDAPANVVINPESKPTAEINALGRSFSKLDKKYHFLEESLSDLPKIEDFTNELKIQEDNRIKATQKQNRTNALWAFGGAIVSGAVVKSWFSKWFSTFATKSDIKSIKQRDDMPYAKRNTIALNRINRMLNIVTPALNKGKEINIEAVIRELSDIRNILR